ncbi:MAG: 50S ribosomal protein L25 [Patescibacteria group bacterium]
MSLYQLVAAPRDALGRKVNALRRDGAVPANIVCKGKDSRSIQVDYLTLEKALNEVGYTQPVELELGSDKVTVLVTDITLVPAKNTLQHVTFQEVRKGEKVKADVPLVLTGDAPGAAQGLIVLQILDTVEVEAGALSIPESLEVDVTSLTEDGDTVRISALTVPDGVEIQDDLESTIVRIEAPRVVEEEPEEVEGEEAEEGAEGEGGSSEDGSDAALAEDSKDQ